MTIKSTEHKDQEAFQNSEEFKGKAKSRYKIEAKNSELKHRHGYDVASYVWYANARSHGHFCGKSQTNTDINEGINIKNTR